MRVAFENGSGTIKSRAKERKGNLLELVPRAMPKPPGASRRAFETACLGSRLVGSILGSHLRKLAQPRRIRKTWPQLPLSHEFVLHPSFYLPRTTQSQAGCVLKRAVEKTIEMAYYRRNSVVLLG